MSLPKGLAAFARDKILGCPRSGPPACAGHGIRPETCGTRPKWKWPRIGGAIKRGAALCQVLVSCDHYGSVKLLGEIISAFSPQNSSSTEEGVWTRRESNLRRLRGVQAACRNPERSEGPLHFDREPCYRCTTGPERSFRDGAEDGKRVMSDFVVRVPIWDDSLRWCRDSSGLAIPVIGSFEFLPRLRVESDMA